MRATIVFMELTPQQLDWIKRLHHGSVHLLLINQAKTHLSHDTLRDFRYAMHEDGACLVWGDPEGLDCVFEVRACEDTGLWRCGHLSAPVANPAVQLPKRPNGLPSPSFPATLTSWAINAFSQPGAHVLAVGTIRKAADQVCTVSGRHAVELATMNPFVTSPVGGWPGRPELTDPAKHLLFDTKWKEDPLTGCHIWMAAKDSDGYGRCSVGGRQYRAHKYAYERAYGPIYNLDLQLGHECGRVACCNPLHVHPEPQPDNLDEMWRDRRARAGKS